LEVELLSEILNVNVGAEAGVVGKVPAGVVGVVINDDVVGVPEPAVGVVEVIGGDAEVEAIEEEAAAVSAAETVDIAGAEVAGEVSVGPGLVEVVVVLAAVVPDPLAVVVNVGGIGMAWGVVVVSRRCAGGRAVRGWGAVLRDVAAADVASAAWVSTAAGTALMLRDGWCST